MSQQGEEMNGRREIDKDTPRKNLALYATISIQALALAVTFGYKANDIDKILENDRRQDMEIKAVVTIIAEKHYDKTELDRFVINPFKDEMKELQGAIREVGKSVNQIRNTQYKFISEYHIKARQ